MGFAVALKNVSKRYDSTGLILENLSFDIKPGAFVSLLGASGSGKSTLLRLISGLEDPAAGSVQTGMGRKKMSFVFQDAHLMPWRTVLQNVVLPLELMGVNITERETRALAALEQVGLSEAALLYPSQLSGGMKMRVSLARALINEPELLLLDEPFAALDETTRFYLAEKLSELWAKRKMTVIFVTHSILDAVFLSESVIILGPKPIQKVKEISIALPQPRNYALRSDSRYHEWTNKISKAFHEISPLSFEANPPIVFRDGLT